MTQTDPRILKCLQTIDNTADANLLFDLLARLIGELGLGKDDERLALNARTDQKDKERFVMSINSRLVLSLLRNEAVNSLGFAVWKSDFQSFSKSIKGIDKVWDFKKEKRQAVFFEISVSDFQSQPHEPLLQAWLRHGQDHLQTQKASQFRKHNIPLLFEMAVNATTRAEVFTEKANSLSAENPEKPLSPLYPRMPLNTILYGPPGTGKTYTTLEKAVQCALPHFLPAGGTESEKRNSYRQQYETLVAAGQIRFVTFHQSFSYEDFIEGIKPVMDEEGDGTLRYEVRDGIFKTICTAAKAPANNNFKAAWNALQQELSSLEGEKLQLKTPSGKNFAIDLNGRGNFRLYTGTGEKSMGSLTYKGVAEQFISGNYYKWWVGYYQGLIAYLQSEHELKKDLSAGNTKPYVLIIDEINRGNVSQIFGELITLLEEDKRAGGKEALSVQLPYSGDIFSVPANLYIMGTMNTADRSVEALDTALRRRFAFEEMPPRADLLWGKTVLVAGKDYNLGVLLQTLNERMEVLAGRDHQLGHSFFCRQPAETGKR